MFLFSTLVVAVCCLFAVVVVLASTRIIKSVVTGQASVTVEWKNPSGKHENKLKAWTKRERLVIDDNVLTLALFLPEI